MSKPKTHPAAETAGILLDIAEVIGTDVDPFGPAKIVTFESASIGARAILVSHNTARGPAIGGVRFAADVTPYEVYELARAMTWKNAAALIPHGGAKSAIIADPGRFPHGSPQREDLFGWFAACIEPYEDYIPGPDMNTDERDMAVIFRHIRRSIGRPEGIPLDKLGLTALGALHAYEVLVRGGFVDGIREVAASTMALEGFGNVGSALARYAAEEGVAIVAASDLPDPARDYGGVVYHPEGLDLERLLALRAEGRSVVDTDQPGVEVRRGRAELEHIFTYPVDVVVPAARTNTVTPEVARGLRARLVLEAANKPLTEEADRHLFERGVVCATDYLVNCGGVIAGAEAWAELRRPLGSLRIPHCVARIIDTVTENLRQVHTLARERNIPPRAAAAEIVRPRIAAPA
jgi:glutamate dehydrogenase/leucine dehydrogenase